MAVKELPVIRERGVCCALPAVEARWADERAELMKALADPTRLRMMASLTRAAGPICICDFTAGLGLTQPTISHHMARLKRAGLVQSHRKGIWIYYRLNERMPEGTRNLLIELLD